MQPSSQHVRQHKLFRLSVLGASLAIALSDFAAANQASALSSDIPVSWPLPYERGAQVTPLRARIDALRLARPAPADHHAASLHVTNCNDDDSAGSLRTVISKAVSGDTIDLTALTCSRISLSQGALKIELDDLSLHGPGATRLTIDGENQDRVVLHPGSGTLTIEGLTLANGHFEAVGNDIGFGGCVATAASLTLRNSVIRDCVAVGVGSYGGAVLSGFLSMTESTISGSTAFGDHPTNGTAAYGGGAFSYGVDLLDSTITTNSAIGTDNAPLTHWEIGGGLFIARNGGSIERTTISNNFAIRFAGGLTQEGDLILRNSTVSGNSTRDDDGGGLLIRQFTAVTIENSTITGNHAGTTGGGISAINFALPSTIQSSIVAGNTASGNGADINSTMPLTISGSHNLILLTGGNVALPEDTLNSNPHLLPLAENGGPTRTHALGADSPAIDQGDNPQNRATDQRGLGYLREADGATDIGAYEVQGAALEPTSLPTLGPWTSILLAALLGALGWRHRRDDARLPARIN